MDNFIGRLTVTGSGLKLESQKIVKFSGKMEERQKWKNRTECALDGSGYEPILTNREYSLRLYNQNRVVFLQLSVATSEGMAFHLVKQFEDEKDRYAALQALMEWFDGDVLKTEMANTVRNRLENYRLGNGYTAS
eukprot:2726652-Ditylum_brightwellii.AAC.1